MENNAYDVYRLKIDQLIELVKNTNNVFQCDLDKCEYDYNTSSVNVEISFFGEDDCEEYVCQSVDLWLDQNNLRDKIKTKVYCLKYLSPNGDSNCTDIIWDKRIELSYHTKLNSKSTIEYEVVVFKGGCFQNRKNVRLSLNELLPVMEGIKHNEKCSLVRFIPILSLGHPIIELKDNFIKG